MFVDRNNAMDYSMFTDTGNAAVGGIVVTAKTLGLSWEQAFKALHALSQIEGFGEATDTAVREVVYDAVANENEDFYI